MFTWEVLQIFILMKNLLKLNFNLKIFEKKLMKRIRKMNMNFSHRVSSQ